MSTYRTSSSREEILKVLQTISSLDGAFTIWQKVGEDRIQYNNIKVKDVSFDGTIEVDLVGQNVDFDGGEPIYFLLSGKDFAFKTYHAFNQGEFLTLQVPREIKLIEQRSAPRVNYQLEDRIEVELFFRDRQNKAVFAKAPILNISEGGLCICVSKETFEKIDPNSKVIFKGLKFFKEELNDVGVGELRHHRIHRKKKINLEELFAIGFQFKESSSEAQQLV